MSLWFPECKTRGLCSELLRSWCLSKCGLLAKEGLLGSPRATDLHAQRPEDRRHTELSSWSPSPLEKQGSYNLLLMSTNWKVTGASQGLGPRDSWCGIK